MFMSDLQQTMNLTKTENGALGYSSTFNTLLDFNFKISSYRKATKQIITDWNSVLMDHTIDLKTKIKYLFYLRDIRGGLGERNTFRHCFAITLSKYPSLSSSILEIIPEYGRWDDLIWLLEYFKDDTDIVKKTDITKKIKSIIQSQWEQDIKDCNNEKPISLLAKWLPSINTSSKRTKMLGRMVANMLGLQEKTYRKTLSRLRGYLNIVERNLSQATYDKIQYSQVPSKAALLYKQAFMKHDPERYLEYIKGLQNGTEKINASATMPYEIVYQYTEQLGLCFGGTIFSSLNPEKTVAEDPILENAWKSIPCEDISDTLVVCDSSGSMRAPVNGCSTVSCIEVSNALAIFFAEHSKGEFKDKFITFSSRPQFVDLSKTKSLSEKLQIASRYAECSNTNLKAVFDMILKTAMDNQMKSEDLPKNILICSDMHFDPQRFNVTETLMENIRESYELAGYTMPCIVWWNLTSHITVLPEIKGNVKLVSGFSQNNYKLIMTDTIDPWGALLEIINSERYSIIGEVFDEKLNC